MEQRGLMKINKNIFVKSLEQIKLIIGNGFDLHCSLSTTYNDYFRDNECMETIKSWQLNNPYSNILFSYLKANKKENIMYNGFDMEVPNKFTVWDIFFFNKSLNKKEKQWCDIEKEIKGSLISNAPKEKAISFWETIFNIINENMEYQNKLEFDSEKSVIYCALYMRRKFSRSLNQVKIKEEKRAQFYEILLEELKLFEKCFGEYIIKQIEKNNDQYAKEFHKFMYKISNKPLENIISIDSFNFSNLNLVKEDNLVNIKAFKNFYSGMFCNINGDVHNPIFGIDSSELTPGDSAYIFTKTSRRLMQDITNNYIYKPIDYRNIVIYGHSLNRQDYSFFFPIFDYLKIDDVLQNTHIVFAYSVYDVKKALVIQKNQMKSISSIIYAYEKYIHPDRKEMRLLDSLSEKRRIVLYRI